MVARSQRLQRRSTVSKANPADPERGNFWATRGKVRFDQTGQTRQNEKYAGDDSGGSQREMVNHAANADAISSQVCRHRRSIQAESGRALNPNIEQLPDQIVCSLEDDDLVGARAARQARGICFARAFAKNLQLAADQAVD